VTDADTPVEFGQEVTDNADLDVPDGAGGTLTFKAYGPSATPVCTDPDPEAVPPVEGNLVFTSEVTVDGPGVYNSDPTPDDDTDDFIPELAGSYYWVVSYSGDDDPPTDQVTGACGDDGETSVVTQPPSSLTTAQRYIPQDTATLTGTGIFDGTLTFKLFDSLEDCQADPNTALAVYTETVDVPADTAAGTSFTTNNDGVPADESTTDTDTDAGYGITETVDNTAHFWEVIYSGDSVRADATSACVEDATAFTVDDTNAPPAPTP
jgi:hypothetical protein